MIIFFILTPLRFDITQIGKNHLRQIFQNHLVSVMAFPLYITAFWLHQVITKIDDKLALFHHLNSSDLTYIDTFNVSVCKFIYKIIYEKIKFLLLNSINYC